MVRDMNRFLDDPPHQQAIAQVLDLNGSDLVAAIERVKKKQAPNRIQALHDLYVERLESSAGVGGRRFVTSVRVAEDGRADTVYFLVHATGHEKGKREMKEAIWESNWRPQRSLGLKRPHGDGRRGWSSEHVRDRGDPYSHGGHSETPALPLLERFAGQRIEFEALQNASVVGHMLDGFIDKHIKDALDELGVGGASSGFEVECRPYGSRRGDFERAT